MSVGSVVKKVLLVGVIGFVGLVVIGIIAAIVMPDDDSVAPASSPSVTQQAHNTGDTMKTGKVALIITSIKFLSQVGDEYLNSTASEGATYVAVRFKYKNISGSPIGMFGKPTVQLADPSGNGYEEDLGATTYYSSQVGDNEKVISDLNPGISVSSCSVFEVSSELLEHNGWRLVVESDGSSFTVNVK